MLDLHIITYIDRVMGRKGPWCGAQINTRQYYHLVARLRINGAIPSMPYTPLWRGAPLNTKQYYHLVARLRINGAIPPMSYMFLWRGAQTQNNIII
jgi:hypothetical protein